LVIALLSLAGPLSLQSQVSTPSQVSGVVTDQTNAAIAAAEVVFTSRSFKATQVTDNRGAFVFSQVPAESGVVKVSAPGFQVRNIDWHAGTSRLEITLPPATAAEQVTVTANRTGVRLVENATSVTVLSAPDLEATAAFRLDDILRQVPGFSLFRRTTSRAANPTTQGVSLRGLGASGASRALVLSDGFPLNDPFGGWIYWDRAPRESIGSVEVASGGASHLYGSDALGGVINIIRKPVDRDAISLEAAYGNENSPDLSLAASRKMGPWSVGIASELFRTDGYIAVPSDLRGAVDTAVSSQDATGDVTVQRKFGDRGGIFVRGSVFGESRHNGTPLQTNSTTIRELDLGGNWDAHEFGAFQLRAYASRQNLDQSFSSIASNRNSENLTRTQRVPAQQVGFSVQWQHTLGTRQHLVAGVEESNTHGQTNEQGFFGGNPTNTSHGGGREVTWGAYLEDIIRVTPSWLLTASGRVDHWQNFDAFAPPNPAQAVGAVPLPDRSETFFSPRLALLHKLTSNVSLTASGYRAFRAPTLNELYRGFRAGNVFTEFNPNLRAERLTGAEGGAIVTGWNQRLMLRGNFFWNQITRPVANVTLTTTPSLITRQRQNLGSTVSQGVEFEASSQLSNSVTVSGGYQYTHATVTSFSVDPALAGLNPSLVGLNVPQIPRHQFDIQARYSRPFILLAVQGRFGGNQFDDDQNTLLLRRYFTLDATASHTLRHGVDVFVAVENLLNQRYDVGRTPVLTVGPPILARAGLRLQFGSR
jgi:outer membrane receptor protein involved in Fe transport